MMFSSRAQKKSKSGRPARGTHAGARRLYSVAAWPEQRAFVGTLSLGATAHKFSYSPSSAGAINKRLQLIGRFTITDPSGHTRTLNSVRATLVGTQGGVGTGPIRRQIISAEAPTGVQKNSQQENRIAGEREKVANEKKAQATGSLPVTENTGATSYCGVLYFHFEGFNTRALGGTDLTGLQLNVRLAPVDETAETLHVLYCNVVDALYGEHPDDRLAADALRELNRVFAG